MRSVFLLSLFLVVSAVARSEAQPIRIGDPINLIPPATNVDGRVVVFAAATAPDGTAETGTNIYVFTQSQAPAVRRLTNYSGDSTLSGVTSVAYQGSGIAYTTTPGSNGAEEVHLLSQTPFGVDDRTLASDTEGCVQPLCANCVRHCVGPVHLTADEGKVLYAVARQQPFFVVNADGSGLTRLAIYSGAFAPSPQRVISRTGLVVFTSSAPAGPTFAAAATDVYVMNLDGTGVKQVTKFGNASIFASNATISAGAELIAFESNFSPNGPEAVNQVWVASPDGSGLRKLSTGPDNAGSPSISADGSVVTFVQSGQIKSVRTSGGGTVASLTKLSISVPSNPVISDDGSQVVFTLAPQSASSAAIYRTPTDSFYDIRSFVSIYAPHLLNPNGVVSAAGYGAPSPGSLISIYGANIGADELVAAMEFPLPTSLKEVSLLVNGQPIPLLAVTPWQINAQLPQTVPSGTAAFQIRYAGGLLLPPVNVDVKSVSPANFVIPFVRGNLYYPQAAAFHAGTRIVADTDHPAVVGEKLEIYGLGLGVTDPVVAAGIASPASPPARAIAKPRLQIGGVDATVTFAGLTPGLAGVYQVNAIVPAGVPSGLQSLAWVGPDGLVSYSSIAIQ